MLAFVRWSCAKREGVLAIYNFTPVTRDEYCMKLSCPPGTRWRVLLCSDCKLFGGEGSSPISDFADDFVEIASFMCSNSKAATFVTTSVDNAATECSSQLQLKVPGLSACFLELLQQ